MSEQKIDWPSHESLIAEEKKVDKWRERASTHRFFPPEIAEVNERLQILQYIFLAFQKKHPEIVGFTLHGSYVRGKATEKSDFDGTIYHEVTEKDKIPIPRNTLEFLETDFDVEFVSYVAGNKNEKEFLQILKNNLISSVEQLEHLHFYPINDKLIDLAVKDYNGSHSPMPYLTKMFHLSIGKGLDKYRKCFFDKVESRINSKEDKEKIWQEILERLKYEESGREFHNDKLYIETNEKGEMVAKPFQNLEDRRGYPKTFDEARQKYCKL